MRNTTHVYIITACTAAACIILSGSMRAGEYHTGRQDVCSDCHVPHASKQGKTWTPTDKLLKTTAGEVALCMTCHDGANPNAPDIVAAGTSANPANAVSTEYSSKYGSSAGFFQGDYLSAPNPCGHDLQTGAFLTAPLSNTYSKAGGLVCSDCHDPHSTANYRNLVSDPNPNNPGSFDILIGTHISESTPVNALAPNPAAAYDADNVSFYVSNNISAWCADCHDMLSQNTAASSPAHFRGHPSNVGMDEPGAHTDLPNWITPAAQADSGFGTDIEDSTAGIPRVRFGSPSGSSTSASGSDTILCLSCHKAHGSKYRYAMVWPYQQASADSISGCQQCHFK